ncbi:MAG: response regulator transcription factor [Rhizobacter sp.]
MHIFLLEDDPLHMAHFVSSLQSTPTEITHFAQPHEFFRAISEARAQVIVLDWMLPGVNGLQVLRRVRELLGSSVPVVMHSCVDDESQIVDALAAGADDYWIKPVPATILRARMESFMRRFAPRLEAPKVLNMGPYKLDYLRQLAQIEDQVVNLTPKEFDIAWILMNNPDRFISKAELIASVWGRTAEIAAHTIAQHMHAVRKKLQLTQNGVRLVAVYGSGYRFEVPQEVVDSQYHDAVSL